MTSLLNIQRCDTNAVSALAPGRIGSPSSARKTLRRMSRRSIPVLPSTGNVRHVTKGAQQLPAYRTTLEYADRTNALVNGQVSFSCGNCSATFPTQIGLSQHERHVHPSVRNQKRLATAAAPRKRTVGERSSRPKIWTEEEEQRLRELNEVYRGKYYINTLLMPHFPGKTSKQISDKRYLLGLTKPVDGQATSGRATAVSRSLDDLTQQLPLDLTINNVLRPQVTVPKLDMEEERNWRQCMLASAARTFAKYRQSLAKDAAIDSLAVEVCSIADALRTAEDIASASDLHKPKLDSIVDELTAILAGNKPLPSSNSRRGNIPNARRKPRGNRDRMRRQQYATVQSLWAKDPKLLATMVAEDTLADIEKRRQPELPKGDQEHPRASIKYKCKFCGKIYQIRHAALCDMRKCPMVVVAAAAAPPPSGSGNNDEPSNSPLPESEGQACPNYGEKLHRPRCVGTAPAASAPYHPK
nr:unnamed protein product [Callosobruchus analis]